MFGRKDLIKEELIPCHVLIRTIGNLPVFSLQEDCFRYVFQIYAANVGKPGLNLHRQNINQAAADLLEGRDISSNLIKKEHNPLVNIISFSLVKNHAHFILSANKKNGIPEFINKLNLGFAKYFNIRNKRFGSLFNKPFKIISIMGNSCLNLLVWYVNIKSPLEVSDDFNDYQFSSFLDLFGSRQSKITMPKSEAKCLGISLERIEEQANKINLKEQIFLEEINA